MSSDIQHEQLLIIDFGSQVTKLIARRVRESGVYSEVHPFNRVDKTMLKAFNPKAIILSGGPNSVTAWELRALMIMCGRWAYLYSVFVMASKPCARSLAEPSKVQMKKSLDALI